MASRGESRYISKKPSPVGWAFCCSPEFSKKSGSTKKLTNFERVRL
jgi:hypothetical protein